MSEFSLSWTRSSRCASNTCVEVAVVSDGVLVRDSKDTDIPHLRFSAAAWDDFCYGVAAGEFDFQV
jgi:hypothetical protein